MDWNGDGRDEVLTASTQGVNLFESKGRGADLQWTKTLLTPCDQISDRYHGASEIGVGKVQGHRFLATIEPWHGNKVVVYTRRTGGFSERHVIDASFNNGHALVCADLDGDGNDEIVAGYRGPGTSLFIYHSTDERVTRWERETLDKESDLDAVYVATPDHWHAAISMAAMRKQKHVLCQKPMTHTIGDARRVAQMSREMHVTASLPVNNPSTESTRLISERVAQSLCF